MTVWEQHGDRLRGQREPRSFSDLCRLSMVRQENVSELGENLESLAAE